MASPWLGSRPGSTSWGAPPITLALAILSGSDSALLLPSSPKPPPQRKSSLTSSRPDSPCPSQGTRSSGQAAPCWCRQGMGLEAPILAGASCGPCVTLPAHRLAQPLPSPFWSGLCPNRCHVPLKRR